MRVLQNVLPTPEQLTVIRLNRPGFFVIRGSVGSGKTTSAMLRLRFLANAWLARRERLAITASVKILVLTFNRTLRGYIEELARTSVEEAEGMQLTISTFAKWSKRLTLTDEILDDDVRRSKIISLGRGFRLDPDFLCDEVDYALGRFLPENIEQYLTTPRDGRGASPRVNRARFMEEVIRPYVAWKSERGLPDWNDLAVEVARERLGRGYDVVVADEVQDFSANQLRAIARQLAPEDFSCTFVLDQVQRIYARAFTWREVGISITPRDTVRLTQNYRNSIEIARFAVPLLQGLDVSEDGTIPDFQHCHAHGRKPLVLRGLYGAQVAAAIRYIRQNVDVETESVAFLHPKRWFGYLKERLDQERLRWVEITQRSEWPQGDEFIALSTLHSAKGLEFDHVLLLGLNEEVTRHGEEEGDIQLETLRKLFAMAIGRAKKSVVVGYKPEDASVLVGMLDPETYEARDV